MLKVPQILFVKHFTDDWQEVRLDKREIKWEKRVSVNRSRTTLLWPNLEEATSLKFKADALSRQWLLVIATFLVITTEVCIVPVLCSIWHFETVDTFGTRYRMSTQMNMWKLSWYVIVKPGSQARVWKFEGSQELSIRDRKIVSGVCLPKKIFNPISPGRFNTFSTWGRRNSRPPSNFAFLDPNKTKFGVVIVPHKKKINCSFQKIGQKVTS